MPAAETECRYVRYCDQVRYLDEGWTIIPHDRGPHRAYGVIATRAVV